MPDLSYVSAAEIQRIKLLGSSSEQCTQLFATLCRINALYMIQNAGSGHIGSSFSSMDIISWLFLNELRLPGSSDERENDIYFSSKGHDVPGLYSVLIGAGLLKFDLIHQLRRIGGLPGHPDISIPFMETNTGSLGMGISKAKGMVLANRVNGKKGNIYVLTGDGELQEGQFWESLQSAANLRLNEITVIVDHNKIQSDTWVEKVSDLGDLERKFSGFGWHVARCDGNNLQELESQLLKLKVVQDRPKILIADTIKGSGVSFMDYSLMDTRSELYPFHSGALDEESYKNALNELIEFTNKQLRTLKAAPLKLERIGKQAKPILKQPERLIHAYSQALVKRAESNSHIVALDADLVLDCGLIPFRNRFPERFIECGISEQDMVSQAGGMALNGLLPIVHSFACFLSPRPNEQIYNNSTEKTKIIYVGSLAGLLPGGPGHSHQCVRDIAVLSAVPGLILLEPSSETEVLDAVNFCVDGTSQSCYLRLVSIPYEIPYRLPSSYCLEKGKGVPITDGKDALMFSYGPIMLTEAFKASSILNERFNVGLKVINLPWLNFIDRDWLKEIIGKCQWVFTLDNHYLKGGQGEMLSCQIAELGMSHAVRVKRFGVTKIPVCGTNQEVLEAHRLDSNSLVEDILGCMGIESR